jgi:hypothetical protein
MTTIGRWRPDEVRERLIDGAWEIADDDVGGLALLKPKFLTYAGTSASYTSTGGLEVTDCTSIIPSTIFTAKYDNYLIKFRGTMSSSAAYLYFYYFSYANGYKTTNTYTTQTLLAYSTTVSGSRSTGTAGYMTLGYGTSTLGSEMYLYGPHLTQPTVTRTVNISDYANAFIWDTVVTQSDSESYDSIYIASTAGTFTGTFSFYALAGA